jgi:hypothetical protein
MYWIKIIIIIFLFHFINRIQFTYESCDYGDYTVMKNKRGRTIIITDKLVYKIVKNTKQEISNHLNVQNMIDTQQPYTGAHIPKIYGYDEHSIIFECVGNMTYEQYNKQYGKNNHYNLQKINSKIQEFLNLGKKENKKLNHDDLHMNNIRLDVDSNNDIEEVYVIDLENCELFNHNFIHDIVIDFKNNLYRIPIIKEVYSTNYTF